MAFTRLPVLLFVVLAAHFVNACYRIEKGNKDRIIMNTNSFKADLPPYQDSVVVDVSPFGLGTEVSGVVVDGCLHNFSENTNVRISYKGQRLYFNREADTDSFSDVGFSITVYYVAVIPNAEFLEEGTIGFYDGK